MRTKNKNNAIRFGEKEYGEVYHVAGWLLSSSQQMNIEITKSATYKNAQYFFLNQLKKKFNLDFSLKFVKNSESSRNLFYSTDVIKKNKDNFLQLIAKFQQFAEDWIKELSFSKNMNKFVENLGNFKRKFILVWVRYREDYEVQRNLTIEQLQQLLKIVDNMNYTPIVVRNTLPDENNWNRATSGVPVLNFSEEWCSASQTETGTCFQLAALYYLFKNKVVVASIGHKSGGMDGGSFLGIPTLSIDPYENEKRRKKLRNVNSKIFGYLSVPINNNTINDIENALKFILS